MKKYLGHIMIVVLVIRALLLVFSSDLEKMNLDEESNYHIAQNHVDGKGYTNYSGELSAFHGSFTVLLYEKLIQNDISKQSYILFYYILSILVFVLSIPVFYRLIELLGVPEKMALLSTLIYAFYPSNIYYIAILFRYESIVVPMLVMTFYLLLRAHKKGNMGLGLYWVPLLVTLSSQLRAQIAIVYLLIMSVFMLSVILRSSDRHYFKHGAIICILTLAMMVGSNVPILKKNHEMFGAYILSTQIGYELMQGHNDLAKGGWYSDWWEEKSAYYQYSSAHIPHLETMDQYEEGLARKDFAKNWILDNPFQELKLIAKKSIIFFLPENYLGGFHPINALLHLAFLISVVWMLFGKRIDMDSLLILIPVAGVFLLCQIFFFGFRWRYFAEPFMLIFSTYHLGMRVMEWWKKRRSLAV